MIKTLKNLEKTEIQDGLTNNYYFMVNILMVKKQLNEILCMKIQDAKYIMYYQQFSSSYSFNSGGQYDENSIELSDQVKVSDGYNHNRQLTFYGVYEKVKKQNFGQMQRYIYTSCDGYYDINKDGLKIGEWKDIQDQFSDMKYIIHIGLYDQVKNLYMGYILEFGWLLCKVKTLIQFCDSDGGLYQQGIKLERGLIQMIVLEMKYQQFIQMNTIKVGKCKEMRKI